MSSWEVQDVDADIAFLEMDHLRSLKFKGLKYVSLNNFKSSYAYTKDGGIPINVDNPETETNFEDNAEYHVFFQAVAPLKKIMVKIGMDGIEYGIERFYAPKGRSFTDQYLYEKFKATLLLELYPATPEKVNIVGEENDITFEVRVKRQFKVAFDTAGGSPVSVQKVDKDTPITAPTPPVRSGYTFDGWYVDSSYTTAWNFADPVTSDMTLYAKWTVDTGTGSGGDYKEKKDKPEKSELPKSPKEELPKRSDISQVSDTNSFKQETKGETAIKTAGVLKIGSLDYQALEQGVLVKKKLDVAPIVEKGKTMLPARAVGELLGVSVNYDAKTETAIFIYNGKKVELTMGKKTMKVDGVEKAMSSPMMVKNKRVLLPLRDVQQALKELGLEVNINWYHISKTITLQAKR